MCRSDAVTKVVTNVLFHLAIGRLVEQLEGHELDHTLSREVLRIVHILSLLLRKSEHGSVQKCAERVVVKLTHWHFTSSILVVFDELLKVVKHVLRVASPEQFAVLVHLFLVLCLHSRVEANLLLKALINILIISREVKTDFFESSAVSE